MIISYGLVGQVILHRKLLVNRIDETESSPMMDCIINLRFSDIPSNEAGNQESTLVEERVTKVYREKHAQLDEKENDDTGFNDGKEWYLGRTFNDSGYAIAIDFENRTQVVLAAKTNVQTRWPFQHPDEVKIYFVHVGKAGGRSLYKEI